MKAAVVSSFSAPPRYQDFPAPTPAGPGELAVKVLAAGLHPRVRSQADGSHYTSTGALPLVPGIDGVGRASDGSLRYFVLPDTTMGSMAEWTVIDARRSIVLPEGSDPVAIAAAMNPAMSSWIALRKRVGFEPGGNVLILGATGNAGRMAVQVAKLLGAREIAAAGRDAQRLSQLPALGATRTIQLGQSAEAAAEEWREVASGVDVVLDYLWGQPAADAMTALVTAREDRGRPLTWVEVGSTAGPTAAIPSAALRAAHLQIVGSGQGSVSPRDILAELPALAQRIVEGAFETNARPMPLEQVESAWAEAARSKQRLVLTP